MPAGTSSIYENTHGEMLVNAKQYRFLLGHSTLYFYEDIPEGGMVEIRGCEETKYTVHFFGRVGNYVQIKGGDGLFFHNHIGINVDIETKDGGWVELRRCSLQNNQKFFLTNQLKIKAEKIKISNLNSSVETELIAGDLNISSDVIGQLAIKADTARIEGNITGDIQVNTTTSIYISGSIDANEKEGFFKSDYIKIGGSTRAALIHANTIVIMGDVIGGMINAKHLICSRMIHKASSLYTKQIVRAIIIDGQCDFNALSRYAIDAGDEAFMHHSLQYFSPKNTLLIYAIEKNSWKMVSILLKAGLDAEVSNSNGLKAIHIAAENGFCECLAELICVGVNINSVTMTGLTPLMIAIENRKADCIELLITAALGKRKHIFGVLPQKKYIDSILCTILCYKLYDALRFFIELGGDIHKPLQVQFWREINNECLRNLKLVTDVEINKNETRLLNIMPLAISICIHDIKSAAVLVGNGADIYYANKGKLSMWQLACHLNNEKMLQVLASRISSNQRKIDQSTIGCEIPRDYLCPITSQVMDCPVRVGHHVYERSAIENWIIKHGTNPMTRDLLTLEQLSPDLKCKEEIDRFVRNILTPEVLEIKISLNLTGLFQQENHSQSSTASSACGTSVVWRGCDA